MNKKYTCEVKSINKKAILKIKPIIEGNKTLLKSSEVFKILGDYTRIKILFALSQKELCVCDLAALIKLSPSAI